MTSYKTQTLSAYLIRYIYHSSPFSFSIRIHVPHEVHTLHHHHIEKVPVLHEVPVIKHVPVLHEVPVIKHVPFVQHVHVPIYKTVAVEKPVLVPVPYKDHIHVHSSWH